MRVVTEEMLDFLQLRNDALTTENEMLKTEINKLVMGIDVYDAIVVSNLNEEQIYYSLKQNENEH